MTSNRPGVLANTTLRLLSEQEMKFGLDPNDQAMMWHRANILLLEQTTNRLVQKVEVFARRAAAQRLAEGKEAYVQVAGIDGIVRQNTDGTRDLVEMIDGQPVFIRSI